MKRSAGILLYRRSRGFIEVLLAHPGGPYFKRKDAGAWSIPKGEYQQEEQPLAAARREFEEETGMRLENDLEWLGEVQQAGGKIVSAWAREGDCDPAVIRSNTFSLQWPPRSGKLQEFPEVDRFEWFTIDQARQKIIPAQAAFLDQLVKLHGGA